MNGLGFFTFFLALGTAWLSPALAQETPDLGRIEALGKAAPPEIGRFITRKLECYHWAGEEPYDRERAREIRRAIARLGCDALEKDEASLRKTYATSPKSLEALDAAQGL